MKNQFKTLLILAIILPVLSFGQAFQLNFSTFEKYLTQNYTPEKVKTELSSKYALVNLGVSEWKFRDNSKSWEALIYLQLDNSTKKIKELQFTAPNNRVYELMDELEKTLGFKLTGSVDQIDIYENKSKKLGAKIVPADFLTKGLVTFRIYRL